LSNHVRTDRQVCETRLRAAAREMIRAPAFRRSRSRHSPPATTPMAQLQNRVSRGGR